MNGGSERLPDSMRYACKSFVFFSVFMSRNDMTRYESTSGIH